MNEKMTTLMGGRRVQIQFADGRTEEILVRQLPVRDYDTAFVVLEDEMALTSLICGRKLDKTWIAGTREDGGDGLLPESYELLQAAAREVNAKGFFAFAARRLARENATTQQLIEAMRGMTPEQITAATMAGAQARSTSPTGSPGSAPRPR